MKIMVMERTDNIERLREVGEEWLQSALLTEIPIPMDANIGLATLRALVASPAGDVLVLCGTDRIEGFMGLIYRNNHVGPGRFANECLFYVSLAARGGGLRLIRAAEKLAKSKGCTHLILNASRLAGDADRSGKLFERCGYAPLETSYLRTL